ncbi:MAG: hypothetical protein JSV65_09305 [Armatimonadota bacterium]|nr:MAG: hypothetical protein JSV65_09305 [Armatimonadota bacterium]
MQVADVLARRIARRSSVEAAVVAEGRLKRGTGDIAVFIGLPANHDRLAALCGAKGVREPDESDPGPEGFAAKTVTTPAGRAILAAGVDKRGVLYAAGEILRRISYGLDAVSVPSIDVRTAPAFRYRGSSANQGGTMRQITGARGWSTEESHEYTIHLALAGANCFYAGGEYFDFVKSFDLMAETGARPNEMKSPFPQEWQATERGNWVCPSIPEARKALLEQWEQDFAARQDHDVLRMFAGDPGGCRCPRCAPWGKTFVLLAAEMAKIWLRHHPNSTVQIANQDLDNAGDQAVFDYLNEEPRTWLYAICYGPGSNAMSEYFRSELREDLFAYPGHGPINRYLREILNQIPKYQRIVHYSDITHWISAQYQVENPEPHVVSVYGRRTFHTRPRAYYDVFQAIMPFAEGDIIYSEGYHDEFHQYMWNRLLWDPNRSLDDVMTEYARLHFGDDAAPEMVEAMLQLEKNLEAPLATNDGVERYYLLVKSAGWKIPPHLMGDDHRWRLHMQKAALDKYLQSKLRREMNREQRATRIIERAAAARDVAAAAAAEAVLDEPLETPDMAALRAEAGRLGEESDAIFGVRNVGYFRLDEELIPLDWLRGQLERARVADGDEALRILDRMVRYEDPGDGGFYDDAGNPARQPHLVKGDTYDVRRWMDPANRPSQNTIAFSFDDGKGVVFRYTGLDTQARYRVRLTMVTPRIPRSELPAGAVRRTQHVVADGEYLAKDIETPEYTAQQFEYDIPQSATADGELELWLEKGTGGMATVVSEVWLMKNP